MHQGRERKWFYPFWPTTWLEKERDLESPRGGYQACHHADLFSEKENGKKRGEKKQGFAYCHVRGIWLRCQQVHHAATFFSVDKRKIKGSAPESSTELLALKIHLAASVQPFVDTFMNKPMLLKWGDLRNRSLQKLTSWLSSPQSQSACVQQKNIQCCPNSYLF